MKLLYFLQRSLLLWCSVSWKSMVCVNSVSGLKLLCVGGCWKRGRHKLEKTKWTTKKAIGFIRAAYWNSGATTAVQWSFFAFNYTKLCTSCMRLHQGWGTCGPREHLIWPASNFAVPKIEHNIASKWSSMISRYLYSKSRYVSLPHS